MKRLVLSLLLIVLFGSARIEGHAFLQRAEPSVGSTVQKSPGAVRIWFTENIEPAFSAIKVFDATQKQIDEKDTHSDARNRTLLKVSLPSLRPGTYKVIWHVTSVDGHVTNGDFAFRVLP